MELDKLKRMMIQKIKHTYTVDMLIKYLKAEVNWIEFNRRDIDDKAT